MENFKFLVSLLLHLKNMETQTAKTAKKLSYFGLIKRTPSITQFFRKQI